MDTEFNPIRTLIVDDSENECALLRAELCDIPSIRLIGFVHDGVEALAYVRGVEGFRDREAFPYPDLMLLDFQMPRCDGMEVLRCLRHKSRRPMIVLWSNNVDQIDVPLALHLGADIVCRKPFHQSELFDIIDRMKAKWFNRIPIPVRRNIGQPIPISR